jgi:hypothetical protein
MSEKWPAEKTVALHRLISQQHTDLDIAIALGVSLRAVIGKRQREGLSVNRRRAGGVLIGRTLPVMGDAE